MLLFIDDATRFTSVYISKRKSEALYRFKDYKVEMEKQTGKAVKRLHTDGGGDMHLENSRSSSSKVS